MYKAYVDGSFSGGKIGFGFVVLNGDKKIGLGWGRVRKHLESRQIGGELMASMKVISFCNKRGIENITIYYDYLGIEMWATNKWKTNKPVSIEYKNFMNSSNININWVKVKAHSGDRYNNLADRLAKRGSERN